MIAIRVLYTCRLCGLDNVGVDVPARGDENVLVWMDSTARQLSEDHAKRSPNCYPKTLDEIKIPITGANKVGGPCVN